MIVLSLFDGMSCGQIALERIGIKIDKYYASEINKESIKITQKNYPDTIQLGDVTKLDSEKLESLGKINLLFGGSPCTNLSMIVINNYDHNQGLKGEHSKLFYEFVRILHETKPDYFLLENVEGMSDQDKDVITETLKVMPIMIDSSLVSAQDRKRYYWTNIPNIKQPEDKGLCIADVLEAEVDEKYFHSQTYDFHGDDKKVTATLHVNTHDMLKRVYNPKFKCATLTACRGGYKQKKLC